MTRFHFRWQNPFFNHFSLTNLPSKSKKSMKKAAMILSSLPLKMNVSYRNRTYNRVLGGPRYIHLTKETNAVFSGFSALLAPAAISMNSITLVMNFHYILFWHSDQSLLESNSDLSLLNFHKSQPWLNLRRWPQCIYSLSTGIKKMQLYQGFSPCSL